MSRSRKDTALRFALAMVFTALGVSEAAATQRETGRDGTESLRVFLKEAMRAQAYRDPLWDTHIEFADDLDSASKLGQAAANRDTRAPRFATLRRSFGRGGVRPFFGVGLGDASTQFDAGEDDALALKYVVGTSMSIDGKLDAYVQYGYSVLSEDGPHALDGGAAHGIQFGLSIALD